MVLRILNRVSEKIPLGGWGREGGRAEQNSGPFEIVLNFEMRFEKKKDISEGVGGRYVLTLMMVVVLAR